MLTVSRTVPEPGPALDDIDMVEASMRLYGDPEDLRAMQRLAQRVWSLASHCHVGDLAWRRYQHLGREADWPTALWDVGGEVVAWGWVELPGSLDLLVDPAWPDLTSEVLEWFSGIATAPQVTVTVLDAEVHVIAGLERDGYTCQNDSYFYSYLSRQLDGLPDPELPTGYRARPVHGEQDVARRVAVHRAAWHPSRVTEDSYRILMASWPYRAELDWIIEAPDGQFVTSCLIWLDELNGVGELEPVGTVPQLRRRGLGRAVCLAALRALHESGAKLAVVYPVQGHPNYPGAFPLYRSLGCEPYARTVTYTKSPRAVSLAM